MKNKLTLLPLLVMAILALVVAGCGDDDSDSGDTSAVESTDTGSDNSGDETAGSETGGTGGGSTSVSMVEYAFDPSPIEVSKGDTIEVTNDGAITHNISIADEGVSSPDVEPGDSGEAVIDLAPGEYDAVCTIGNHAALGMETTVTVK